MRRIALLVLAATSLRADVTLAPLFTDHAVLQRDKPVPIWGKAERGETVTVTFRNQSKRTSTDKDGRWIVYLDPMPGSAESTDLAVAGKNTLTRSDIVVGDVWLCSGQSNMEWTVSKAANAEAEIASAQFPLIRHVKIKKQQSAQPTDTAEGQWETCSPATVGSFSAVGFFFARDLQPRLDVPIGLINSTWGGTMIEAWLSPAAVVKEPALAEIPTRWEKTIAGYPEKTLIHQTAVEAWKLDEATAKAKGEKFTKPRPRAPKGPGHQDTPTFLYNGMIHPLAPYALRGVLWYQGESNGYSPAGYDSLFSALIRTWREHFQQPDLPFLWVQLANYRAPLSDWALLREAQARALALPNTGQAVAIDLGDPDDIHPKNKQEVARRLALVARAKIFGASLDYSGPEYAEAHAKGAKMVVKFNHAGTGLFARDRPLHSFEIAGADRKFHPATATIEGDTVIVVCPEVKEPVAVRYAWSNSPAANLYNGAGLPAAPFRSDDW